MLTKNWLAHNKKYFQTVFYLYLVFVFVVTQMPASSTNGLGKIPFFVPLVEFQFTDKIVHFFLFFTLAITFFLAFKKNNYFVFFFTFGISFLIEILQLTLPFGRDFDWFDLLANGLGTLTAIFLIRKFL